MAFQLRLKQRCPFLEVVLFVKILPPGLYEEVFKISGLLNFCILELVHIHRVILIIEPTCRVMNNVLSDALQFLLIADDMFVLITLPKGMSRCIVNTIDHVCAPRLKCPHNVTNRRGGIYHALISELVH